MVGNQIATFQSHVTTLVNPEQLLILLNALLFFQVVVTGHLTIQQAPQKQHFASALGYEVVLTSVL